MSAMRRWLRGNTAQLFVVAFLVIQLVPVMQACALPMTGVSMAYGQADMPDPCAGLPKEGCLLSYIQADRTSGSVSVILSGQPPTALPVSLPAIVARDNGSCAHADTIPHSGAPPPRLLVCRMLE